jgi:HK97 family phage portal protein
MTLPEVVEAHGLINASGQTVTPETSRRVATGYRCINVLSDDVAKMPLQQFISRSSGQIERVRPDNRIQNTAWLMEVSPNRWMTPFLFKKALAMWAITWGAGYAWQPPRMPGARRELFILNSAATIPVFDIQGNLFYQTTFSTGETEYIPDVEVFALLINSMDGITGRSVLTYARETIGRQLGAYETQGKFYSQGLNPGGIVYVGGDLDKTARDKIRNSYGEAMSGSSNAYRLAVMDSKITKFEAITMKPVDAQFLESIQATDVEIANFFGVPLYKLNSGKQSYNSNEQQNLDYLTTTLDPYLVQWEQAAALRWLTELEQNYTYFRFNRDVLLRTDAKTRAETLEKRIISGQMSPNEAREIEDMPAYPGGESFYMPANINKIGGGNA